MFLLANAGLSLYSNGILVREDYLKAEPAKVKAFVKASLQGWKDAIANPKEAADIVGKHVKGLDPDVLLQEVAIVNSLVASRTRAPGGSAPSTPRFGVERGPHRRRQGRGEGCVRCERPAAAAD
ncbi:MAG: hypothetical protein EXQ83_06755 [Xanthobacteraceae bacterium]|nr:hypothetical protein [Xanthobacteraceae bacterium]